MKHLVAMKYAQTLRSFHRCFFSLRFRFSSVSDNPANTFFILKLDSIHFWYGERVFQSIASSNTISIFYEDLIFNREWKAFCVLIHFFIRRGFQLTRCEFCQFIWSLKKKKAEKKFVKLKSKLQMKNFTQQLQKNQKLEAYLHTWLRKWFIKTWQLDQEAESDGKIMTWSSSLMHSTSSIVLRYFWQSASRIDKSFS